MATVINNPSGTVERRASDDGSAAAAWGAALVVLIVLAVVGVFLWQRSIAPATPAQQSTPSNINVTLPSGSAGQTQTTPTGNQQTSPSSGSNPSGATANPTGY